MSCSSIARYAPARLQMIDQAAGDRRDSASSPRSIMFSTRTASIVCSSAVNT
jgi:hypothetical protein